MSTKKAEIVGSVGIYSAANQLTHCLSVAGGLITRHFLGPVQMGMWATLQLVLEYSKYSKLGTTAATAREIPYYIGKGEEQKADNIKNVAVSFGMLTAVITSAAVFIYAFLFRNTLDSVMWWGVLTVAAMVLLQRFNNLIIGLIRSYKEFRLASKQMLLSAVVNLALIALLTARFKIYGFFAASILSLLFNIIYITSRYHFNFKWRMDRSLTSLISYGLPLQILGALTSVYRSVDKLVIIYFLGFKAMGLYSVATMVSKFLDQIPFSVNVIMIPHFQEKYGERDSVEDIKNYVDKAVLGLIHVIPILIGMAWIGLPWMVTVLLPEYVDSIMSARLLILGSFFSSLTLPYGNFLIAHKKHFLMFPVSAIAITVAFILDFVAIRMGYDLDGIAAATAVVYFLNFIILFTLSASYLYKPREIRTWLTRLGVHFLFLCGALFIVSAAVEMDSLFLKTCVQFALFMILCIPAFISLEAHFGVFTMIRNKLEKRK